jgi:hypothetical protein
MMTAVEPGGVDAQKPFHACHQIGAGRLHDQMEMVWHQAESLHLPACFPAGFRQSAKEQHAIRITFENGFAPVAPIHDTIDGAGIFDPKFSGHTDELAAQKGECQ